MCAHLLRRLGQPCNVAAVVNALEDGRKGGLWDFLIVVGDGESRVRVWMDYDGGYYHRENRLQRDTAKTIAKLAKDT